ncbi:SANT and BTB domain regulator of class switch recombination isoform X2 [Corythoichthys intestinalis]|uniref:SANT and BTB domain regulator of class switch recombination isoform X2 n=1 Tax=Corythoichthys intestinalis TaxID=161448 RepID=UPI0025A5B90A|nr:SANT and BTB domain regulator of class switch recombination isoform X2 [Corythoichthys intestinalis]
MSRCSLDNNNFPFDNNVLVLDMVLGSLWGLSQPIDWDSVAKIVPSFTPKECALRFEELKSCGGLPQLDDHCNAVITGVPSDVVSTVLNTGQAVETGSHHRASNGTGRKSTLSGSICSSERKDKKALSEDAEKPPKQRDPNMVIHVCDETKNLKQDFTCPRDLLVKEMRYFAEYLSVDSQRWEEVDISVHCDVQIFDWLMNYVRRNSSKDKPRLEPSNVISILISSEFLKMDTLVEECIQYCHKHMSAIVATPCSMNCINSNLVSRIAELFNHNEADDVRDKKDKFKSKLFQKKIELLFDPNYKNRDSPRNASTLYRCGLCLKMLTDDTQRKISCVPGTINIDSNGEIVYTHSRQKNWDANEYISSLYEELKSWVLVYWRIWGTVNCLTCSRCQQEFICAELTRCRYHPESVTYPGTGSGMDKSWNGTGIYPCCNQTVLRFDPTGMPKGCRMRDHIVNVPNEDECDEVMSAQTRVLNDLLLHRDAVCVSDSILADSEECPTNMEKDCEILLEPALLRNQRGELSTFSLLKNWSLQLRQQSLLSEDDEYTTGSEVTEDEVGDEEELSKKQAAKKAKKNNRVLKKQMSSPNLQRKVKQTDKSQSRDNTPFTVSIQKSKWDNSRSMRYNQDAQREEDQRRMAEITDYLTKMRFGDHEQNRFKDTKEPAGGIYSRLEAHFKSATQSRHAFDKTPRPKLRYAQIRTNTEK